ncbi:MAG TPA: hypothetical protein VF678_01000 [bacterium]
MVWKEIRAFAARYPLLTNLLVLATLYTLAYLAERSAPGGRGAASLGWWGWYDQGAYLRSAEALSVGNLTPDQHTYPILYPALGSLFIRLLRLHLFVPVNLAGLLVTIGVFITVAGAHVRMRWAAGLFWLSVLMLPFVYRQYTIPWNSTLAGALLALLIWELHGGAGLPGKSGAWRCFRFTLVAFLLVPTRPLDALASAPLCLMFLYRLARTSRTGSPRWGARSWLQRIGGAALGAAPGILIFLGFNLLSSGNLAGRYVTDRIDARQVYELHLLPMKVVAFLFDSGTVHGDAASSFLSHYPWLILTLMGMAVMVACGNSLLRAVALTVMLQMMLYLPFTNFMPQSLWRYGNIHYYKWFAPYAVLIPLVAAMLVYREWHRPRVRYAALGAMALMLAVSCVGFRADPVAMDLRVRDGQHIDIANPAGNAADFFSLRGTVEPFEAAYMGDHVLRAGSRELIAVRDFRVVPTASGARVIFMKPFSAARAELQLTPETTMHVEAAPSAQRYAFTFGVPRWLWRSRD